MVSTIKFKQGGWLAVIACMVLSGVVTRSAVASHQRPEPPVATTPDEDRGGGGMPDPLTVFNQHVELADGELYLLKGTVVMAPALLGSSRKLQPYFRVDLEAHPWLSGKKRKESPLYLIEGAQSTWRPFEGSYGDLAAEAHVQLLMTQSGDTVQVISLKPIPELSSIPHRY